MSETIAKFPAKLRFLFEPSRYKVARGGRGSGKSWGVARALLIRGATQTTRVLCAREVQKSIQQSVYQLLRDQVESLGLGSFYDVLATEIRGKNGTQFYFAGLSDQTADSLKSFEGVDITWVEEAQSVSKRSWDILIPTIRKERSEIWITYNPQLDTDETHRRFTIEPPPNCVNVELNYSDNPYFPTVLEAERKHAKATMKAEEYAHIWEGKCKPAVEGAIYFDQMAQAEKRIGNIPQDGTLKTHAVWDLGFNDSMAIILVQKLASELRIVHYIEGQQRTLADYSAELKGLRLDGQPINWGTHYLPHDGFAKRHQTGKSDANVMTGLGWKVERTPQNDVEGGIKRAREVFSRVYFNKERAARLIECLKRYRRHINSATNEPGSPVHDEFSHGCLVGDSIVKTRRGPIQIKDVEIGDFVWTPAGWSEVTNSGLTKLATDLLRIDLADGRYLVCTPEHKVLSSIGFVRADALSDNCRVYNGMEWQCVLTRLFSMVIGTGYRATITGETSGGQKDRQTFTERFGSFITAQSQKVLKFITLMATPSITSPATLSASKCTSTSGSTCWSGFSAESCIRHQKTHCAKPPSGTDPLKGVSGIRSTEPKRGQTAHGLRSIVRNAASRFIRLTLRGPSSATRIAKLSRLESAGEPIPVYDLTVKNSGCYQANGLLVSNSDAFRYMAMCADNMTNEQEGWDKPLEINTSYIV